MNVPLQIVSGVVEVVAVVGFFASLQARTPIFTAARIESAADLSSRISGVTWAVITTFGPRGSTKTHRAQSPAGPAACYRAELADDAAAANRSLAGSRPPVAMAGSDGLPGGIEDYNEIPER